MTTIRLPKRSAVLVAGTAVNESKDMLALLVMLGSMFIAIALEKTVNAETTVQLLSIAVGLLALRFYQTYSVAINSKSVSVTSGVLNKRYAELKFEKIESGVVTQTLIQRVFGVYTIELFTLGSGDDGVRMLHLKSEQVDIIKSKSPSILESAQHGVERVSFFNLLLCVLSFPSLKSKFVVQGALIVGSAFILINSSFSNLMEANRRMSVASSEGIDYQTIPLFASMYPSIINNLAIIVLVGLCALIVFGAVGKCYYFLVHNNPWRWWIDSDSVRMTSGMLFKSSKTLKLMDIKAVHVFYPDWAFVRKLQGVELISVEGDRESIILPLLTESQLTDLLERLKLSQVESGLNWRATSAASIMKRMLLIMTCFGLAALWLVATMAPDARASIDLVSSWPLWLTLLAMCLLAPLYLSSRHRLAFSGDTVFVSKLRLNPGVIIFKRDNAKQQSTLNNRLLDANRHSWHFQLSGKQLKVLAVSRQRNRDR